ncbi:hypothetical protein BDV97DRAFT_343379 [Delphinella strobiligena]|nr:hypothetical protein BDV97DRAFT_343379 [Delphinella strobiligena]
MSIMPDYDLAADYLATIVKIFPDAGQIDMKKIAPHLWMILAVAAEHDGKLQAEQYISHDGVTLMHVFMAHYLNAASWSHYVEAEEPRLQWEEDRRAWLEESIRNAVLTWTNGLVAAGIDLHDFATREKAATHLGYTFVDYYRWPSQSGLGSFTTIDMSCGQQAADWDMAFSWRLDKDDISEELATQFWDMLDHSALAMPGAWNEGWDAGGLTTYYSQSQKPSRHWMKKRASMTAAGTRLKGWDYWDNGWCKNHVFAHPCERCIKKNLCSKHQDLECGECSPCRTACEDKSLLAVC